MLFQSIIAIAAFSASVSAAPQYTGSSSYSGSSGSSYSGSSASGYSGSSSSGYSGSGSGYSGSGSGYSGSGSGYSGSSSGYSGSSSGYSDSGCSSGDCGYSDTDTVLATSTYLASSAMMTDSTSIMMTDSISTSTMMTESALATSVSVSYTMPSYGSGSSSSWSDSGYDGCVQQCIASFGSPSSYTPTVTSGSSGSSGTGGVTHTVIVAPSEGVLRFVPFATNASVGDTILFHWGANNHTVTKSSELTPCNKTSDAPFSSGEQNAGFSFTQVVNDTNPTFFYCGTPTHCEKGMFGIINAPSTFNAPTSVSQMMSSVIANDTTGDVATYATYTNNQTSGSMAASWGANIDMSAIPSWAQESVVENVLFTRNVLALNPDMMSADGSVAVSSAPMMIPPDIGSALAAASSATSVSSASGSSASGSSASSTSAPSSTTSKSANGATSITSQRALVGAVILVATYFAL